MEFELKNVEATTRLLIGFQKGLHSVMAAMDGLDIASKRLAKEEELTPVEESILEQHTIHSKKNHLKTVEDAIEGNDNNLDGIINNMPEDAPSESTLKKAKEYEKLIEKKDEVVKVAKPHKQDLGEIVR